LKSLGQLERATEATLARGARLVHAHPRTLASVVALSLACFGAAAYGIAQTAPDASDLPRRLVTEIVAHEDLPSQLEALAGHELQLYRSEQTRAGDGADLHAGGELGDPLDELFHRLQRSQAHGGAELVHLCVHAHVRPRSRL